jgi:hypothetical protein
MAVSAFMAKKCVRGGGAFGAAVAGRENTLGR